MLYSLSLLIGSLLIPAGAQAASTSFEWTTNGLCYEYTPGGAPIRQVESDICRKEKPSYVEWTTNGICYEYTPANRPIRQVETDICRKQKPSYVDWTTNGICYEYTPAGRPIRQVESDTCRKQKPTYVNWTTNALCYEYTPSARPIRQVESDRCREASALNAFDPNLLVSGSKADEQSGAMLESARAKVIPQASTPAQPGSATSMDLQ